MRAGGHFGVFGVYSIGTNERLQAPSQIDGWYLLVSYNNRIAVDSGSAIRLESDRQVQRRCYKAAIGRWGDENDLRRSRYTTATASGRIIGEGRFLFGYQLKGASRPNRQITDNCPNSRLCDCGQRKKYRRLELTQTSTHRCRILAATFISLPGLRPLPRRRKEPSSLDGLGRARHSRSSPAWRVATPRHGRS